MGKGGKPEATVDEIIATINRSNFTTIVVEGDDDIVVYRRLEDIFADREVSVLSAFGRVNVLSLFDRRNEINNSKPLVFICDKDIWVMIGVPNKYDDNLLIVGDGYSIENDIIRDGDIIQTMTKAERIVFDQELNDYLRWYSVEISRLDAGESPSIDLHPNRIFDQKEIAAPSIADIERNDNYKAYYTLIFSDYCKLLRGKSLMNLIIRQLSAKGRKPRHNSQSLLEIGSAKPGPLLKSIFDRVDHLTNSRH